MRPSIDLHALLKPRRLLALADALCCAILLFMLAYDAVWPRDNLFLQRPVKVFILVTGLLSAACGVAQAARQREALRRAARRRGR